MYFKLQKKLRLKLHKDRKTIKDKGTFIVRYKGKIQKVQKIMVNKYKKEIESSV